MERLPTELCMKIFSLLDHHNLAIAQQVCRKWKGLASDNMLWSVLFEERWGSDRASAYAPSDPSRPWKCVYEVQDRRDRVGLGPKIIRECEEYFVVHQGEIRCHLGSRQQPNDANAYLIESEFCETESLKEKAEIGILDRILFFIGDLETDSSRAKRIRYT